VRKPVFQHKTEIICVMTVRQSGHLLWHRSRHSLQAMKCLHWK